MLTRRKRPTTAFLVAIAVLGSACGGGSNGVSTTTRRAAGPDSTTTTIAAVSTTTIAPEAASQPTATTRTEGHGERQIESIRGMVDATVWAEVTPSEDQLTEALDQLSGILANDPDHVEALILFAWVGHLLNATTAKTVFTPDDDPHTEYANTIAAYEPVLEALDHVLALEPENSEAHYCKAAVYGHNVMDMRDGTLKVGPMDRELAIESAYAAVEYDPDNLHYQDTLLANLFFGDRFEEAATVAERVFPDIPLTSWMRSIADPPPIPDNAILLEAATNDFANQLLDPGLDPRYRLSWVRIYMVPTDLAAVEALYQATVPEFHWLGECGEPEVFATSCVQGLIATDSGYALLSEEAATTSVFGTDGRFLLYVHEYDQLPSELSPRWYQIDIEVPPNTPDRFCILTLVSVAPS